MYRPRRRGDLDSGQIGQAGVLLKDHGLAAKFFKLVEGVLLGLSRGHSGSAYSLVYLVDRPRLFSTG